MTYTKFPIIYPYNINGYIKLNTSDKEKIINFLTKKFKRKIDIAYALDKHPDFIFNFIKAEKIHSRTFSKILKLMKNETLINKIILFSDDKGGSSIPFMGKFPIKYTPLWHFVFCLSIGDGYISKRTKRFVWYQKPEGQLEVIKLLIKMGFNYPINLKPTKQGITIPQLIRKVGSYVTELYSKNSIKSKICNVSSHLGKPYELAFLCAFFIDEAGMGKGKATSEITLHQESDLNLLSKIGNLLNKYKIPWSKNKKGNKWVIRLKLGGIIILGKLFKSLNKYGVSLLHREEIFQKKLKKARKTFYMIPLKAEAITIRNKLLSNYKNKIITIAEIRYLYQSNFNISCRSRKLVDTMKKKKELTHISLGKYKVVGVKP